jgi:hypothetical protein
VDADQISRHRAADVELQTVPQREPLPRHP